MLALSFVLIPSFWWFFLQSLIVSSYLCTDWCSKIWGSLYTSLELSLCAATFPSVFYLTNLSHFHLPELWTMSPPLSKTVSHCHVLLALYPQRITPNKVGKSSAHPFHFPSVRDFCYPLSENCCFMFSLVF